MENNSKWISIVFIALYSALYSLTLIGDKVIDVSAIFYCSVGLAFASFLISYSLYNRISKSELLAEARKW